MSKDDTGMSGSDDSHMPPAGSAGSNGNKGHDMGYEQGYAQRSRFIHGEMVSPHWDYSHHVVPPMSASATYRLDSGQRGAQGFCQFGTTEAVEQEILIYDRLQEPTSSMLEDRLAEAERAAVGISFATGMAAISAAITSLVTTGQHVIAHKCLYGCTTSLLKNWYPRIGINVSFIDTDNPDELRAAIRPETRVVYLETPVNPTLEIIDLRRMSDVLDEVNAKRPPEERIYSICDNTFATPLCQRPREHGVDVVVHSLTKGIGGFGTDMGGIVLCPLELEPMYKLYRKDFGGSLSPKAAWPPLVYGLPTLPVRMRQMQYNAQKVAEYLSDHPLVAKVRYPGLADNPDHAVARRQMTNFDGAFMPGSLLYFTLKEEPGSNDNAEAMINWTADNSYVITLAVSLGQVKTLIENPSSMTHSALDPEMQAEGGVEPGGIRLSCGLEETNDIIRDLEAALMYVASRKREKV
ncbi:MAG: aminotransferase class I/II-fold pyridoxal phosphate-dependent enzyme [Planctomycetales bacterium]|nr:aminotransferase class I/II-fold pyridoxal phosphate-dependent enzyme [bacterium]UNM09393.1 MAG: aminotransferase class I/II-fold pyridoxal phosphate-dependent enzyme [Planctomycetales bacterium]